MTVLIALLAVAHVGLIAAWMGSMLYSLLIVQPRVGRYLRDDDDRLEELLTVLGAGNRRPVLALIAGIAVTGGLLAWAEPLSAARAVLFGVEAASVLVAAGLFAHITWRLWPRRLFALPDERAAHRSILRRYAYTMTGLMAATFAAAVAGVTLSSP